MKRGMVNDNAGLCHHLFVIPQAQGVSEIPTNTLRDDIDGIIQTFKGVSDQRYGRVISQKSMLAIKPLNATEAKKRPDKDIRPYVLNYFIFNI